VRGGDEFSGGIVVIEQSFADFSRDEALRFAHHGRAPKAG
jgi:hypothetical protein